MLQDILDELIHQLDWVGPNGKVMGHVVLKRSDAADLVREICTMQIELRKRQPIFVLPAED